MSLAGWSVVIGAVLLSLMLLGTLIGRLPLSSAMLYLGIGWLLGPAVLGVLTPDPIQYAPLLETVAEIALLISLFAVGLQLGVPLWDRRWWLPLRLAVISMTCMVALITLFGVMALGLPLGAAILLGGILAPTDPVLASGVQSEPGSRPDRLGFSLAGEGGLNDGAAFPFVMLGLALIAQPSTSPPLHWWSVELLWSPLVGTVLGGALGAAMGQLVVYLRARHREAVGLDVFLGLGLIGLSYGLAQLCHASGFLAVFASGLALQRVDEKPIADSPPLGAAEEAEGHSYETLATHSHHASATMRDSVQLFNGQLEKLAELALVMVVGAMLAYAAPLSATLWFVPLLLVVLRPVSVLPAIMGEQLSVQQGVMLSWFGIRGIGSIYYLMFALRHGLEVRIADVLVALTLWTVAISIVVHGLSAQPLMRRYLSRHD
ncbi:cation:proton antiporter [Roseateles cellulosilyticus]|uniref:Sodium:proton antiporter n=1 Tax=Pelomonas cellulosilytica TaxID=2906762 RepID=A0ABS8Y0A5_9BURK|nr:sodium:proton antiporter [Pelomonas sp. P8]MCE4558249.1 sodium:proton antiporter [Pelomonas sp. P8]